MGIIFGVILCGMAGAIVVSAVNQRSYFLGVCAVVLGEIGQFFVISS